MKRKWIVAVMMALVMTVVSMPLSQMPAFAENAADYYEISILTEDTRKEIYNVSSLDTAEQDVTFRVGLYIQSESWGEEDYIEMVSANWSASNSNYIRFSNILDLKKNSAKKEIPYSGGTYRSRYTPYCFVQTFDDDGIETEINRPFTITTTKNAYDPKFGSVIRQAENGQIQFQIVYYETHEDMLADCEENTTKRKKAKTYYCDVQYDSEGTAYYEYTYISQDTYQEATAIGYLPGYDPSIPVGETIPGMCNYLIWLYSGTEPTAFFGASSDEFPMITFDVTVKKGTPSGIYSVDFLTDEGKTFLSGKQSKMHVPASANGLTIVVDENAPRLSDIAVQTTTAVTTTTTEEQTTTETMPKTTETTAISSAFTQTDVIQTTMETAMTTTWSAPIYLTPTCYICAGEEADLVLEYAEDSNIHWVSDNSDIVYLEETDGNYALMRGMKPGTTTVYAVYEGQAYPCVVTVQESTQQMLLYGDVNRDDRVALNDVVLINRYIIGSVKLDMYAMKNADCDAGGSVDIMDSMVLLQFLVHQVDDLPSTIQ